MRLILADDSTLFRRGLAALLAEAGNQIVAQHADATGLLDSVAAGRPDVAIVDIRMPPTGTTEGLLAAIEIREREPDVGVLVLSPYVETTHAVRLLSASAGGVGYLPKDRVGEVTELVDALIRIDPAGPSSTPRWSPLPVHRRTRGVLGRGRRFLTGPGAARLATDSSPTAGPQVRPG
jgi:DNA-binding NarL/FixJ family response regulator